MAVVLDGVWLYVGDAQNGDERGDERTGGVETVGGD